MRPGPYDPAGRDGVPGRRDVDGEERPHLGRRDIWRLIWATYVTTFPLLLVFLLALALATWLLTELIF